MAGKNELEPSKSYLLRGDTIQKMLDRADALWAGDNIQRGPGILRRGSGSAGFSLAARTTAQQVQAASAIHIPFGVAISKSGAAYKATVNSRGSLLRNYVLNNNQAITGLDSPFVFDFGNDLIWLDITIDPTTGLPTATTVNSYGLGGVWAPSDLPSEYGTGHGFFEYQITFDSEGNSIFTQYLARIPIFESTTSSVSPFPVSNIQMLNANLIMTGDVYSGPTTSDGDAIIGISMPKPFSAPFITT